MIVVIAPDSFKESLSATDVAQAIEKGVRQAAQEVSCILKPMADGGEGTLSALIAGSGGTLVSSLVHDPLMNPVKAFWGIMGDRQTAVVELAASSGLSLVPAEKRNPMITSTYGFGELIREALAQGFSKFILCLGGSATNDGGAGMLQALGYRLLDAEGNDLPPGGAALIRLHTIDSTRRHPLLCQAQFKVACDVTNPLCGPLGASCIFGPQKGATPLMVSLLDEALHHFAEVARMHNGKNMVNVPGAGAAGGLGAGLLAFLNSELIRGAELVIKYNRLEEAVSKADLVITGEGVIDSQTLYGKAPVEVARLSQKYHVPCIGLCGKIGKDAEKLYDQGFLSLFSITDRPMTLQESISETSELLQQTSCHILRTFLIQHP